MGQFCSPCRQTTKRKKAKEKSKRKEKKGGAAVGQTGPAGRASPRTRQRSLAAARLDRLGREPRHCARPVPPARKAGPLVALAGRLRPGHTWAPVRGRRRLAGSSIAPRGCPLAQLARSILIDQEAARSARVWIELILRGKGSPKADRCPRLD
jgi:hypothetical protein